MYNIYLSSTITANIYCVYYVLGLIQIHLIPDNNPDR